MSSIEPNIESRVSSPEDEIIDVESESFNIVNQNYRADKIEHLLKLSVDSKQYSITKNPSQLIKSDVWSIFGFPGKLKPNGGYQLVPGFVSCYTCFKTLPYDGSTKYMNKHKCSNISIDVNRNSRQKTVDQYLGKQIIVSNQDKERLKDKVVTWSCLSIRPFTIVEDFGFMDIVKEAIMIDLWFDKHRKIGYIGLSCSFINERFQLITIDLCCSEYDEMDKTGKCVYMAIRKQLADFDLEKYFDNKTLLFMSDRGSNLVKALEDHDVLFCFGHRINNILQRSFYQTALKQDKDSNTRLATTPIKRRMDILNTSDEELDSDDDDICKRPSPSKHPEAATVFSKLLDKPRELLDVISASKSLVKYVKVTGLNQEIQQNHGVALQQSNVTRWLSLSSLLKSVEASIEHVRCIISSKPAAEKQKLNLNKIHIDGLKDLVKLLETFEDVIKMIQTGDRPTLHMAYVCQKKLKLHLDGKDIDFNGNPKLIDDRYEGTDFFRQRIKQLLMLMFHLDKKHLAAALLHPQYRKLSFIDDYKRSKTYIYVQQLLTEMYDSGSIQQTYSTTVPYEPLKKKNRTIEEQFADPDENDDELCDSNEPSSLIKGDELARYFKIQVDHKFKISNPLDFWQHHQDKLPNLAKIARRLFSIPVTSAGVERQFSAAGLLINERRASLNPETVEDVLFVRSIKKALIKYPDLFST